MAFGFQSINSSGSVQIDDGYRNLRLVASGTWPSPTNSDFLITFPTQTSTSPLIFFRPSADGVYVGNGGIDASSFMFAANGAFDWQVYGLDNVVSATGSHGLQVFNGAGQTVFDSRIKVPRIQTILSTNQIWPSYAQGGSLGAWTAYPYNLDYTGWGQKPWICLNSLFFFEDDSGTMTCATTSGYSRVILQCGHWFNGWQWNSNDGGNGSYALSHPYGQVRIPIAK